MDKTVVFLLCHKTEQIRRSASSRYQKLHICFSLLFIQSNAAFLFVNTDRKVVLFE